MGPVRTCDDSQVVQTVHDADVIREQEPAGREAEAERRMASTTQRLGRRMPARQSAVLC